jgi:hypothetical protein
MYDCYVACRMLETELQRVQDNSAQRERDLLQAVTELRADNERQQKLIGKVGVKVMSSIERCRRRSSLSRFFVKFA